MSLRSARVVLETLVLGPLLLACAGERGGPPPKTHTVEIREMQFHPGEIRANRGDTIVWVNRDLVPHTATASDSAWTSPALAQGERWQMVVGTSTAGDYLCAFHPVMEARLVVEHSTRTQEQIP